MTSVTHDRLTWRDLPSPPPELSNFLFFLLLESKINSTTHPLPYPAPEPTSASLPYPAPAPYPAPLTTPPLPHQPAVTADQVTFSLLSNTTSSSSFEVHHLSKGKTKVTIEFDWEAISNFCFILKKRHLSGRSFIPFYPLYTLLFNNFWENNFLWNTNNEIISSD